MKLRFAFFLLSAFIAIASCKPSREKQLLGLWQEVGSINPQMDSALSQQRIFADTVGANADSATNFSRYGVTNIDTFRKALHTNMDSFRRAQNKAIAETWFEFQKGGIMYMHSEDGLDSANWYFEDDALMLDEAKLKGGGAKLRMEVKTLNDTALALQYNEKFLSSTALFRRVKR